MNPITLLRKLAYGKWVGWTALSIIVLCIVVWYATRETLPRQIVIATAQEGGQFHKCGQVIGRHLEQRTGRKVRLRPSHGSVQNRDILLAGDADLAIIQNGATPLDGLAVIAPLYRDVVHVVARGGRGMQSVRDLAGRNVVLGKEGSGMRASALHVLEHYAVSLDGLRHTDRYFTQLAADADLDAAFVTTGFVNRDLRALLATGDFELLPIEDAEAISIHHPYYSPTTIPRGLYHEGPPVPAAPVKTVWTTAFLAARADVPEPLIAEALAVLYERYLDPNQPLSLITLKEARDWSDLPLHPVTSRYLRPYEGLGLVANLMESLAAGKELLFALGAGVYFLWVWRRRVAERTAAEAISEKKERLDVLLNETVEIERAQMGSEDAVRLREYLNKVTQIKLQALKELTDEELRGDRLFSIFLMQCANLTRKLQSKISLVSIRERDPRPPAAE